MAEMTLEGSPYLRTLAEGLHRSISIFWTAPRIVSPRLTFSHFPEVQELFKRPLTIWENLNANDDDQRRLSLGPLLDRSSELIDELVGSFLNPSCQFELNFILLNTLGRWTRGTGENPLRVERALDNALNDCSEELNGLNIDELRLLLHFFFLPYQNGPQAQELFNEFFWLCSNLRRSEVTERWKERSSASQARAKEIGQFYQRLIGMSNRSVLSGYIPDLKACISLSGEYLRWIETKPSPTTIFISGDVEPLFI